MKIILVFTLFFSTLLFGGDYAVVANKNMEDLSLNQIRAIFLKKLLVVNETKVVPLNLEARDMIRMKFDQDILGMSIERLQAHWSKEHYLGHRPPVSLKSQESIKAFVKKVDGSIGYVELNNVDDNLKILYKWSD